MKILLLLLIAQHVYGSPFELTEKYIEEFNVGIKNLQELSENYIFKEEHLDPTVLNEEEAAKSKFPTQFKQLLRRITTNWIFFSVSRRGRVRFRCDRCGFSGFGGSQSSVRSTRMEGTVVGGGRQRNTRRSDTVPERSSVEHTTNMGFHHRTGRDLVQR